MTDDAEVVLLGMGTVASPGRTAVRRLRQQGHKVGYVNLRWFRPFPTVELRGSLSRFKAVGVTLPYSAALFLQTLIALGVALPSAPGFFGVFEKFATVGLGIYGVSATQATSWAIGFHILSFIPITLIGMWYFARLGLHLKEINSAREAQT